MQSTFVEEKLAPIEIVRPDSPIYDPVKLLPLSRQPGTVRFKTGLSEAVLAMEARLVSLEASIQREQEFSAQQRETLARVSAIPFPTCLCGFSFSSVCVKYMFLTPNTMGCKLRFNVLKVHARAPEQCVGK